MENSVLTIRSAKLEDINEIMSIEPEAFGNYHWSTEIFKNELINDYAKYFIAELNTINKIIVGYIGYWLICDEGHITTLAVSQNYKRKHIADILLYNLISNALKNNIKWLTLEVRISNKAAIILYKKYNFKQIGIRKKYYQDNNEDALILWTDDITSKDFQINLNKNYSLISLYQSSTDKCRYDLSRDII